MAVTGRFRRPSSYPDLTTLLSAIFIDTNSPRRRPASAKRATTSRLRVTQDSSAHVREQSRARLHDMGQCSAPVWSPLHYSQPYGPRAEQPAGSRLPPAEPRKVRPPGPVLMTGRRIPQEGAGIHSRNPILQQRASPSAGPGCSGGTFKPTMSSTRTQRIRVTSCPSGDARLAGAATHGIQLVALVGAAAVFD